jgi:serine/threonine protein kinase
VEQRHLEHRLWRPHSCESKWEIKQELGRGGQGKTSLVGSKDGSGQQGVFKTLNRGRSVQARGRMYREMVSLDTSAKAQIKVPQVLESNIGEYADENVELYFVMEYIPGKTLKDEITARGRLPLEKAVAVAMDLCQIVAAVHRNDVLHRDLKPDNIVVRNFDTPDLVIVDYGLLYLKEDAAQDLTHSDEQFRNRFLALPETNTPGGDRRDKRSDITAVCAVLYYCITERTWGHFYLGLTFARIELFLLGASVNLEL